MAALVLRWLLSLALMAARLWDDWLRFCLAMELGRALVAVGWFVAAVRRVYGHERRRAAHGAVALLDVVNLSTLDTGPACRPEISPHLFAAIVRRWSPARAWVEWIGLKAGDRPTGAFSFGASKAMVEATLAVLGVPFRTVTPAAWKCAAGIPMGEGRRVSPGPGQSSGGRSTPSCSRGSSTTTGTRPP